MIFKVHPKNILICRNDALGDTILALPCCGIIKKYYPQSRIYFLGRTYTKEAALLSKHVDEFINYDEIKDLPTPELAAFFKTRNINTALVLRMEKHLSLFVKRSGIRYRIGNLHIMRHITACNRFASYSRKIGLNEAQLNLKMLTPLGIHEVPPREQLPDHYGIEHVPELDAELKALLSDKKFNLVLHPMTTGNGPAWQEKYYQELIRKLDTSRFKIFVSGSTGDNKKIAQWDVWNENVVNISGRTPLAELIAFIAHADGLIAGSTGPLHIAAALGIHTLGLYPSVPSGKAGWKWGPVGSYAETLHSDGETLDSITANDILKVIGQWEKI